LSNRRSERKSDVVISSNGVSIPQFDLLTREIIEAAHPRDRTDTGWPREQVTSPVTVPTRNPLTAVDHLPSRKGMNFDDRYCAEFTSSATSGALWNSRTRPDLWWWPDLACGLMEHRRDAVNITLNGTAGMTLDESSGRVGQDVHRPAKRVLARLDRFRSIRNLPGFSLRRRCRSCCRPGWSRANTP